MLIPGLPPIPPNLTRYTLRVELDYTGKAFKGFTRVDYTNAEEIALEKLYFRLYPNLRQSYGGGRIAVDLVTVNGQQAVTQMSLFDSILEVWLPEPIQPGGQVRVGFDTSGSIPVDFGGGDVDSGYGMYNYSQGVYALANFYPMVAVYNSGGWWLDPVYAFGDSVFSDAALYTAEVLTDPGMVVATSGMLVNQQALDGKVMHRYISGPARDFFIITSPDYLVISREMGGTTINSYYLPEHKAGGEKALDTATRALEIFNEHFGPYPYKEYDVVEAPLNRPSGLEYPGMGVIASRLYADPAAPDFNTTVAHEVAHQWWYNMVGNDVLRTPWMDEALATYSSILYWEMVAGSSGRQQALAYYQENYNQNTQNGLDAPVTEPMAYFQESNRIQSYGPVVYAKGGLFFEALRNLIGDEAFFKALQFYNGTHWFSIANSGEILAAFQLATNIQLDDLYQTWLYSPEPATPTPEPTLTATWTQTPEPTPTSTLTPTPEPTLTPTFTETPEPSYTPASRPLVFAAIGDYGGGNQAAGEVASVMMGWQPEFIITLGDNNYPEGSWRTIDDAIGQWFHQYIYNYLGNYGEGSVTLRFFPTLGNHDMMTDGGQPYFEYFTLPGNERYYDFTWGPVHLFALDNLETEPDGFRDSSVQAAWLKDGLEASSSPGISFICITRLTHRDGIALPPGRAGRMRSGVRTRCSPGMITCMRGWKRTGFHIL